MHRVYRPCMYRPLFQEPAVGRIIYSSYSPLSVPFIFTKKIVTGIITITCMPTLQRNNPDGYRWNRQVANHCKQQVGKHQNVNPQLYCTIYTTVPVIAVAVSVDCFRQISRLFAFYLDCVINYCRSSGYKSRTSDIARWGWYLNCRYLKGWHGLTLHPSWIYNYITHKELNEITIPHIWR